MKLDKNSKSMATNFFLDYSLKINYNESIFLKGEYVDKIE